MSSVHAQTETNRDPAFIAGINDTWRFYQDDKNHHWWERRSISGLLQGRSCEGFDTLLECEANATSHGWDKDYVPFMKIKPAS